MDHSKTEAAVANEAVINVADVESSGSNEQPEIALPATENPKAADKINITDPQKGVVYNRK